MPATCSPTCSAAVPLEHATECAVPIERLNASSKRITNGPADDTKFVSTHSSRYRCSLPVRFGTESGISGSDMVTISAEPMAVCGEPGCGTRHALFNLHQWLPAESGARLGGIREQHHHFAGAGPHARLVLHHASRSFEDPARDLEQLADRHRPAGSQVNLFAFDTADAA